jgi:hypothetical protein
MFTPEFKLEAVKLVKERSDKEGWTAARSLAAIAEHELAERDRPRVERHLGEAKLLPGKTLENFDFEAVPMISRAQVSASCAGDGWGLSGFLCARHIMTTNRSQYAKQAQAALRGEACP